MYTHVNILYLGVRTFLNMGRRKVKLFTLATAAFQKNTKSLTNEKEEKNRRNGVYERN